MKKYFLVTANTFNEILTYRLNFVMWRVRTVLGFLTIYFLWNSVMPEYGQLFGYTKHAMLTYILAGQLVSSVVFATRTHEIADNINNGNLSIYLIKPFGYFKYWFFRDLGDKAMNIVFSTVELAVLILILKPAIFIQTNLAYIGLFVVSLILAVFLHFFISAMLSLTGFWSNEVWAPRFIFYILITFFTGGLFPLDILPKPLYELSLVLPFGYLQYFPLKIYLGNLGFGEILQGFLVAIFWVLSLSVLLQFIFRSGLKSYTAAGR